ncbi:MFS transporter [Naasia aerilata]|uniref:MFS transporter n=1 Tax=Naasia aerilata TaxID=1162966 RepID=A0ABM8GA28_9MICO|nr:MFS transporter [Naasia aerilata]BDZ45059.1 MFS transporter [Naasia aerilata]
MSGTFRSLAVHNYRLWFAGATVSNVGTWMQGTAQDWIVFTELTDHDAAAVGVALALQFGPVFVLTPLSGLVADAVDRRRILLVTQIVQGVLSLALGVLTLAGILELWMVFVFAGLLGATAAFDGPARQSFVSELVPRSYIPNAIGLNGTSFTLARFFGPAIAGLLIAVASAGWVFVINFFTFTATIFALILMRRDDLHTEPRSGGPRPTMVSALKVVTQREDLVLVLTSAFLFTALGMNFPIFISTMAVVEFRVGADGFGILTSIVAIGSVTGALLSARREQPSVRVVGLGALAFGLSTAILALAPNVTVFAVLLVALGVTSLTILNGSNAYIQMNSPVEIRGRVMAVYMALIRGSAVFGAPLIGWVANAAGPRVAIAVGALGGFLPALLLILWWARRRDPRLTPSAERGA